MKIVRGLSSALPSPFPVLTIGNFDGQHLGHRALVQTVVDKARQNQGTPMVLSFEPHPIEVLRPEAVHKFLSENQEKFEFFESLGIAELVLLPFTNALAKLTPFQFVSQVLQEGLGVRKILVGENFVFGTKRSGQVRDLIELGKKADFSVEPMAPVLVGNEVVSSTRIRRSLAAGHVKEGAQCLGRPYMLCGTVIPGEQRGSQLGWPTANLPIPGYRVLPADGVYATLAMVNGQSLHSISYIGRRPTFQGGERILEVHLFDTTLDLYGETISVHFIEEVRGDMTFDQPDELVKQMEQDGIRAKKMLQEYSESHKVSSALQVRSG